MKIQQICSLLFKKRRTVYDKCSSMSYTTEDQSIHLAQNGSLPRATDVVDGINFSREPSRDSESLPIVYEGLTFDGLASSRMSLDAPDEPTAREAIPPLFLAIQIDDARAIGAILRQSPELVNNPRYSGYPPIHHACNVRKISALRKLLSHGANVGAHDHLGNTALHLAVSEAWYEGITELLSYGASPDVRSEPPKSVKEMRSETPFHAAVRNGDLTSTTLLLEHKPDMNVCDSDSSTILHLAAQARNMEVMRILLKEKISEEVLTKKDRHSNSILHSALLKSCDPDREAALVEILTMLIDMGTDVDAVDIHGESPLFLAAKLRLPKVVELLLSAGADPTQVTRRGQSLMHAACYGGCATSLSHLLNTGLLNDKVTQADSQDREPFHYAVKSSSIDCCELLLNNGDHLTRRDTDGVSRFNLILSRLPSATQLLQRLFDAHVRLSNKPHHDPDFQISFDYSILLSSEDEDFQSSLVSELTTSNLEPLLKHPLLESFLYFKWQKIKKFFYISVFVYFLYLIIHTLFIILTFGHFEINWNEQPEYLWIFIVLHIAVFILILIPDLIILLANFKKYMRHLETYSKFVALTSSALVLFSCTISVDTYLSNGFQYVSSNISNIIIFPGEEEKAQDSFGHILAHNESLNATKISFVRYAAAISSFFSWIEFMMLLGRFPSLGSYVLMFTRVAKSIIKFMLAFSSLLIGFSLSFMVLFYKSPTFKSFPLSLIKTLMMMIGEIEYGDLYDELQMPTVGLISLVLFLFLVCIVMANLLIGLAVSDIPDLQRQGKIRRLAKQAAYLVSYEKLITVARNLSCFPSSIRILMGSRSKIPRNDSVYPNRSCKSHKYRKCLPEETVQEAILLGSCDEAKEDFTTNMEEEEDIRTLFKSFRMRYSRDRKILNKKLAQLPDASATDKVLKERLDQMQQAMESRLLQLSFQIQLHLQQNQNLVNSNVQANQSRVKVEQGSSA